MDKNEKDKNQLFKRGSAADCFSNKIADPSIAFFRFPKDQERYSTRRDEILRI